MPFKDKLLHENCPACGARITLNGSALNKKITCPKCRQTVVIVQGPEPAQTSAPIPKETNVGSAWRAAIEEATAPESVAQLPSFQPLPRQNEERNPGRTAPVIYCLCKGVIKRQKSGSAWNSAGSACCMCMDQAAS